MKQRKTHSNYWSSDRLTDHQKKIEKKRKAKEQKKQNGKSKCIHPDLRPLSDAPLNPDFHDLTGSEFGAGAIVIGLSRTPKKWLCRCACGGYFTRTTSSIVTASIEGCRGDGADICEECRKIVAAEILRQKEILGRVLSCEEKIQISFNLSMRLNRKASRVRCGTGSDADSTETNSEEIIS